MPQSTPKQIMKLVDNGSVDWLPIQTNFEALFADMKENAAEISALAKRQTWTIVKMFEERGKHEIMSPGKHLRCKCINAFVQLGDGIEMDVKCTFDGGDTVGFTKHEGAGKTRAFRLNDSRVFHFIDAIEIEQTENRRVIYNFTFESMEELKS
jgi:hypothetical protein